jgi:hypothetical protein
MLLLGSLLIRICVAPFVTAAPLRHRSFFLATQPSSGESYSRQQFMKAHHFPFNKTTRRATPSAITADLSTPFALASLLAEFYTRRLLKNQSSYEPIFITHPNHCGKAEITRRLF